MEASDSRVDRLTAAVMRELEASIAPPQRANQRQNLLLLRIKVAAAITRELQGNPFSPMPISRKDAPPS